MAAVDSTSLLPAWVLDRRWLRRWLGGTWFLVRPRNAPHLQRWVRRPGLIDDVIRVERYPKRDRRGRGPRGGRRARVPRYA